MKKNFLLAFSCFLLSFAFGQKSPYFIRNYEPTEYRGYGQTWQVTQDKKGLLYVAGTSFVFQFDDLEWTSIPIRSGAATRQILYDTLHDEIYIGSVSDFGYLRKDSLGRLAYFSFLPQLNEKQKEFLDIWKIHQVGTRFYFQSSERIFIVENKKLIGTIEAPPENKFALLFKCGEKLFVRQRNTGLMEVSGLTTKLIPGTEEFGTVRILGIIPENDEKAWILTGDQGLRAFTGWKKSSAKIEPVITRYDSLLATCGVLGMEWISSDEIGINSRNGLIIFDRNWNLRQIFNKKSGLSDETFSEIFVDREKNIWLVHNNGVSRISYYSPMLFYTDETGFSGTVETVDFYGDQVYLATSEGLFVSGNPVKTGRNPEFRPAIDLRTEVWNILRWKDKMLLSTSEGLIVFDGKKTTYLNHRYTNVSVLMMQEKQPMLMTAERGGFSLHVPDPVSEWREAWHFDMPGIELIHAGMPVRDKKNPDIISFWATTRLKTIIHITANLSDTNWTAREYGKQNNVAEENYYLVTEGDTTWFLSATIAIRHDAAKDKGPESSCFESDPAFFKRLFSLKAKDLRYPLDFRMFLEDIKNPYTVFFGLDSSGYYADSVLLGEYFANTPIQSGCISDHKVLWLLNLQSFTLYNLQHKIDVRQKYYAMLSHVQFKGDSIGLFYPDGRNPGIEIPYTHNGVSFRFSAPYFMYDLQPYFSYMLEGYDTSWSKYSKSSLKEYTSLPEGTYTFRLRAVNGYGMYSEELSFTFTILPPWYRTGWAYTLYVIFGLSGFWLAVRLSARRLRKQKERLEKVVTERTKEVVEQKQQIEHQKGELESAYKDIKDSIHYAQRIQEAIMPDEDGIHSLFADSFIYFQPRDIVSGDFYWFHETSGKIFIACVDCTGHGVPGALMSMVGTTLLNQIVGEKKISSPDTILDELHIGVRHALKQDTGGETRDGMDIAVCVIDKKTDMLQYAGANRAFWLIRNGALTEIKADKFPIAGDQQEDLRHFTAHTVKLENNDCIYLSTDGYADQFGGEKGKKFMVKRFQQLLLSLNGKTMAEQKTLLEKNFVDWKGNLEQVDDVLVMGFRYNRLK